MTDTFDWTPFESDMWTANEVGDEIKGRIRRIETKKGQTGEYPCLTLQVDEDGSEKEVNASARDLKTQLAALNPQVGWWVEIRLEGLRHTGQPSPMKMFQVNARAPRPTAAAPAETVMADALEDVDSF